MKFHEGKDIVLAIPDAHFPFQHRDIIPFLSTVADKYSPDIIVNMGDCIDCHALSDYSHDPDGYSAGMELDKAIEQLQSLYKLFPEVSVCVSNHEVRPFRKAFKTGIPTRFLKEIKAAIEAPKGWNWADRWIFDQVVYEHGESFTGVNAHLLNAKANMKSTVIGHQHSHAGIQYLSNPYEQFFGFNTGCLINSSAYAFAYAKNMKNKPTLGCGIINKGIPHFIPLVENINNRWIGRL